MKFNHILSGLALTAAVLAAGCQKSLEYSDVVYFTGTENSNITNMYVDGPSSMGVTVTSSCKMAADVQVALAVDAAAVDAYNALHGTDYRMLPAGSYRLSDDATPLICETFHVCLLYNVGLVRLYPYCFLYYGC